MPRRQGYNLGYTDSQAIGFFKGYEPVRAHVVENGADFDGTNDNMDTVDATSLTDNKLFLVSFWIHAPAPSADGFIFGNTGNVVQVRINTSQLIQIVANNNGAGQVLNIVSVSSVPTDVWSHVAIAIDLSDTERRFIYIGGNPSSLTVNDYDDETADWSTADSSIGALVGGALKLEGALAEVWIANQYLDISKATNLQRFITAAGKPEKLGADGSRPTGTQPPYYLRNAFGSFETNSGSLGNFTVQGALADQGTSPSD